VFAAQPENSGAWVTVPAGYFFSGSSRIQVEQAYQISAAGYGHDRVRRYGWFDHEIPLRKRYLPAFRIQKVPVTQYEYAHGHRAPFVDAATWQSYGLVHAYKRARSFR